MSAPTIHPDTASVATYASDFDRPPIADTAAPSPRDWPVAKRLGFRFLLLYAVMYTFPGPLDSLPAMGWINTLTSGLTRALVPWFGRVVLRMSATISLQPSGSGDKLFDWVQIAMMLTIAALAAIGWTLVDRRSKSHPKLFAALHLYVRYTLAATMIGYGLDKVFPNQFEPINPVRLTQYFGEAAPGGFAWFFLGFSAPYVIFCGAGETVAALLLFFRRTTTLGAVVGAAVLTNVFALNMAYDIPVKQYSLHLLLMCAFLVACDADRLLNVFIRNRASTPRNEVLLFASPTSRGIAKAAKLLLIPWILGSHAWFEYNALHRFGRLAPRSAFWGIFELERIEKNGVAQQQLLTDRSLWRRISVARGAAAVRLATDSLARFGMRVDSVKHTVRFAAGRDTSKAMTFAYVFPDSGHLELRGQITGDSVFMRFTRKKEESYLLVNRGFHWVNEVPFFR